MGRRPTAVVDTSVVILIGIPPLPTDSKDLVGRRERATETMQQLTRDGVQFVIPAPVVTELSRDGDGEIFASRVFARLGGMRVESFDLEAARKAGAMLASSLRLKSPNEARSVMRVDAMIAGVAEKLAADYLVTANERDFRRYLDAVQSKVAVLAVDQIPAKGQLRLIDRKSGA